MQKNVIENPIVFFDKDRYDQRRRRYAMGIFFIFLVSAIWVASSVLSQFLYTERNFDSPFLVTYIGVCLFAFILPVKWCTDKIGCTRDTTCLSNVVPNCGGGATTAIDDISVVTEYENMKIMEAKNKKKEMREARKKKKQQQKQAEMEGNCTKNSNNNDGTNDNNNVTNNDTKSVSSKGKQYDDDGMTVTSISTAFDLNHPGKHWNHSKHIFVAMHIAPVLFIANWLFNASLQVTSVVSATVLVSTSGMFTLIMAILVKEESFHIVKLLGVILGIVGSVLTARHDFNVQDDYDQYDQTEFICTTENCDYNLWGDTLAVLAAVAFGAYAVQVRLLCPLDEELYSMGLLLGYIGLFIMIPLLPVAAVLITKVEITYEIFILIAIRGFFDYVVSEYLHFRAVVLTNATIATVGLGLTIPMAFFADFIMGKDNIASLSSLLGAISVSFGFLLVNLIGDGNEEEEEEQRRQQHHGGCQPSGEELLENGIPTTIIQQPKKSSSHNTTATTPKSEDFKSKIVL